MKIPFGTPSEPREIGLLNWGGEFPYKPEVSFRAWHDGQYFYIEYKVDEETTKAEQTVLGGEVYMDSCVECFIQPDPENDPHYYNFEFNAAGVTYLTCRTSRYDPEYASREVLESVITEPSLGREPFAEKAIGKPWTLKVSIPVSALFHSGLKSWNGCKMKMNLFKCGQGLSTQAFLTWAPVDTPAPDYHRPEFFRPVEFEDGSAF